MNNDDTDTECFLCIGRRSNHLVNIIVFRIVWAAPLIDAGIDEGTNR